MAMEDSDSIRAEMNAIKKKKSPTIVEVQKYVRYLINIMKYDPESVYEDVRHWDKEKVAAAIKDVERENLKPKPKRYYVSLKEPLEEEF